MLNMALVAHSQEAHTKDLQKDPIKALTIGQQKDRFHGQVGQVKDNGTLVPILLTGVIISLHSNHLVAEADLLIDNSLARLHGKIRSETRLPGQTS